MSGYERLEAFDLAGYQYVLYGEEEKESRGRNDVKYSMKKLNQLCIMEKSDCILLLSIKGTPALRSTQPAQRC